MYDAIKNFPKQFLYKPVIENSDKLGAYERFVVLGMGGSNLAPELLKVRQPNLDIAAHRTYDLPHVPVSHARKTLFIASSYSGNTEETITSFEKALREKVPLAVITTGGTLLALAKRHRIPYVELPNTGIQPRSALGYAIVGISALIGKPAFLRELHALPAALRVSALEKNGKALAKKISGRVPIIYSSIDNFPIAYNWKIKFNETGKVPAFANSFPELNHNEMTGFDVARLTKKLSAPFYFIFLKGKDNPRIVNRMETTAQLYRERRLPVEMLELSGKTPFERIFNALLLADWTAYYTAERYQVEAEQVPMVERFKSLIARMRRRKTS